MKYFYIFILFLFSIQLSSQTACKKVLVETCIDGRSRLHIKGGKLFWQHLYELPPGVHENCVGPTKINGSQWKDWQSTYILSFTTDYRDAEVKVIQKHDIAIMLQKPTISNGWETIYEFNDPSGSSHYYSVEFEFCKAKPESMKKEKKKTETKIVSKKDSARTIVEPTFIESAYYLIYFDNSKTSITKASQIFLNEIYTSLRSNNTIVELFGYTKAQSASNGALKLYDERAMVLCNYLINKGLDQKRIHYIGYGDKAIEDTKSKKLELKILEEN